MSVEFNLYRVRNVIRFPDFICESLLIFMCGNMAHAVSAVPRGIRSDAYHSCGGACHG